MPRGDNIIDCDIHHTWRSRAELVSYLPKKWRELAELGPPGQQVSLLPASLTFPNRKTGHKWREETFPAAGGPPGSDYDLLREQHLDRHGISRATLLFDTGLNSGHPNTYFASALARAANDWNADTWLALPDDRLHGAVLVNTQDPDAAAAEIRRVGAHPKVVAVLLTWNGMGKAFGDPVYHSIYEAAAELDLPIAIHVGSNGLGPQPAGGRPGTRLEHHTLLGQAGQHHLVSFIAHGVFEKFRSLRLMLVEVGVAWLPSVVWKLDTDYHLLKLESPLIKRWPREYVAEHVRLTTQPLELSREPKQLMSLLEAGEMQDLLCYASDYPHWDADDPTYVVRRIPDVWRQSVLHDNAAAFYRWPRRSEVAAVNPITVPSTSVEKPC